MLFLGVFIRIGRRETVSRFFYLCIDLFSHRLFRDGEHLLEVLTNGRFEIFIAFERAQLTEVNIDKCGCRQQYSQDQRQHEPKSINSAKEISFLQSHEYLKITGANTSEGYSGLYQDVLRPCKKMLRVVNSAAKGKEVRAKCKAASTKS